MKTKPPRKRSKYHYTYGGRRASGTPIREYLGRGVVGAWLSDMARQQQAERRQQRKREKQDRAAINAGVRASCEAIGRTKPIVTTALAKLGIFQYNRGEWRRRRKNGTDPRTPTNRGKMDVPEHEWTGDAQAVTNQAIAAWFVIATGDGQVAAVELAKVVHRWRKELLDEGSSGVEQACAEWAIICRLEAVALGAKGRGTRKMSAAFASFLLVRCQAAERRLAAAIRTLNVVRDTRARIQGTPTVSPSNGG